MGAISVVWGSGGGSGGGLSVGGVAGTGVVCAKSWWLFVGVVVQGVGASYPLF